MPQQLRVTRKLDASGAALIGVGSGQQHLMGGQSFFVNVNTGSDSNLGTNPNHPLLTLEKAESLCTAAKHDYIFAQDFWTLTTESPIIFDKTDMHVIGLGSGIMFDNGNDIGALDSDGIAVVMSGCTDLELAGFNIGGKNDDDAISVIGTTFRVHLHDCTFGNNYPCKDGIGEGAAGNMGKWLVERCLFNYQTEEDGINCSMLSSMIRDCVFTQVKEKGIDMPAGQTRNRILNNMFYADVAQNEAIGWAITLGATCAYNMIYGNIASECGGGTVGVDGTNPYLDASAGTLAAKLNGWGGNIFGSAFGTCAAAAS